MKALLLNSSSHDDLNMELIHDITKKILEEKNFQVESVMIEDKEIKECRGCFNCWLKTPGECIHDDEGRIITKTIINSDVVIMLTPVIYGGYSSKMKLVLDRIIPVLLPFFKKIKGEIHHKKRYKKYPKVIVVGMMNGEDQESSEIFCELIKRNALNWYNSFTGDTIVYQKEAKIKKEINELFKYLEVK